MQIPEQPAICKRIPLSLMLAGILLCLWIGGFIWWERSAFPQEESSHLMRYSDLKSQLQNPRQTSELVWFDLASSEVLLQGENIKGSCSENCCLRLQMLDFQLHPEAHEIHCRIQSS